MSATLRNATLTIIDQACSSLSNGLVLIIASRHISGYDFDSLAIAMVLSQLGIGMYRHYAGVQITLDWARNERVASAGIHRLLATLHPALIGASCVVGLLTGHFNLLLITSALLIFPLLSEVSRSQSLGAGNPLVALMVDVTWLAAFLGSTTLFPESASASLYVGTWALASLAGWATAIVRPHYRPTFRRGPYPFAFVNRTFKLRGLEIYLTATGVEFFCLTILPSLLGLDGIGAARLAAAFMSPAGVLSAAISQIALRDYATRREGLSRILSRYETIGMSIAVAWTGVLVVAGKFLAASFGEANHPDTMTVVGVGLTLVAQCAFIGPTAASSALGDLFLLRRSRRMAAVSMTVLSTIAGSLFGISMIPFAIAASIAGGAVLFRATGVSKLRKAAP